MIPTEPDDLLTQGARGVREREARSQATRAQSLRSIAPPVPTAPLTPTRLRALRRRVAAALGGSDAPVRTITIDGGTVRAVIAGEVEEMAGDSIARERLARLLTRDCARRKLVAVLLAALDADGRLAVAELVEGWSDARIGAAGREVLADAWGGDA